MTDPIERAARQAHMTDLPSLIARVEAASGPDRELDFDVWRIDGPYVRWDEHGCAVDFDGDAVAFIDPGQHSRNFYLASDYEDVVPRVTESLDAVVALAERVKPSWRWAVTNADGPNRWPAQGELWIGDHEYIGKHAYPTLALLLALLRAVQAQQNKETT